MNNSNVKNGVEMELKETETTKAWNHLESVPRLHIRKACNKYMTLLRNENWVMALLSGFIALQITVQPVVITVNHEGSLQGSVLWLSLPISHSTFEDRTNRRLTQWRRDWMIVHMKESRVVSHDLKNLELRSAGFFWNQQGGKFFRLLGPQVSVTSPFCCCSPEAAINNI